ncbi:DNA polymerase III subunit delta [Alishewanella longhuensis]|uniref:DNA polymerase III subunit delta n=1 Tax=Alishewanella longhuensis TaxID=1091037 RepID=A0ABQ3L2B8_9ALTE|nr:DNA polymerase III subunit delta [Alishewanella longhuensis]GHG73469.1 DNA polymerase III subunit delta [Alishewanella longhuensis]
MQKLYANQLAAQLTQGLAPCYLVFGEEPLQKFEAVEEIRLAAKQQGFLERISFSADAQFDWQALQNELSAMSLFAERRLIELELVPAKAPAGMNEQLKLLVNQLHNDIVLVIHGSRSHSEVSKLAWFKQLQAQAVQIPIYPLDERQQRQWLQQRAQQLKVQLTSDAVQLLQQHCAGNLLAARQELEKLALTHPTERVDAELFSRFLADHSSYNVFQLIDAVLIGDSAEAMHRLKRLLEQDTEPVMIAWQLQKELLQLRQLSLAAQNGNLNEQFKQLAIWPKRQPLYQQAIKRLTVRWLDYVLQELAAFDRHYKAGQLSDPLLALAHLVTLFCHPLARTFSLQQAYD